MNNSHPYITILIPVKDRANYLFHTLKTCEIQEYKNLRVIVSDDGSVDNTKEIVYSAIKRDDRISYITPGKNSGMRNNFEFALNHVNQGYVIFLGGDDGLMPGGIKRLAALICKTNAELITWNPPIYMYPGTKSDFGLIRIGRNRKSGYINSSNYLHRQAKCLNYISDPETPMFYVKGAASINLVNKVKNRNDKNQFYLSPTPDGYSGIVLAGEVQNFLYEADPITIYGVSPSSQGTAYLSGDEKSINQSEEFFSHSTETKMSDELGNQPYSPLISVMTADYLLTAKKQKDWPGDFGEIDYKQLISQALNELSNGLYSTVRVKRELEILSNIARTNNLSNYYLRCLENR